MSDQLDLFSPHHRRDVTYECPCCDQVHTSDVPAHWVPRRRTFWTTCPHTGEGIRVDLLDGAA